MKSKGRTLWDETWNKMESCFKNRPSLWQIPSKTKRYLSLSMIPVRCSLWFCLASIHCCVSVLKSRSVCRWWRQKFVIVATFVDKLEIFGASEGVFGLEGWGGVLGGEGLVLAGGWLRSQPVRVFFRLNHRRFNFRVFRIDWWTLKNTHF